MSDPLENKYCDHCGASIRHYRHNLNKGMVAGLVALMKLGGCGGLRQMRLTISQHNNFQKLRYWGLIESIKGTYDWRITEVGKSFLQGKIRVHKNVITFRGETVSFEGKAIYINEIDSGYKLPEEWARGE